jgi:hypothetical protein
MRLNFIAVCMLSVGYAERIWFPSDAGAIDITRSPYSADKAGKNDATAAIQKAIHSGTTGSWHIIYLPNGTYKVSNTIFWKSNSSSFGPVLQGESRVGVTIKLKDNATGFGNPSKPKPIFYTGDGVAQKFCRGIRNMTISTGSGNPGAIGVQWYSNNEGIMADVTVRSDDGDGVYGIHTGFSTENGPWLFKNVSVYGFNIGITTGCLNSGTMYTIYLCGQKVCGIDNLNHVVSIENLRTENSPIAVKNMGETATMALVNGEFLGGSGGPAIINEGNMFARDIITTGYEKAMQNSGGNGETVDGTSIYEFSSHGVTSLFDSPSRSLRLPIAQIPAMEWEQDPQKWASIRKFGASPNDTRNDAGGIQKAINSGATTVYFPRGKYYITSDVKITGKVQRIIGCNSSIEGGGKLILENNGPDIVKIERMRRSGVSSNTKIENRSSRVLVLESIILTELIGSSSGDIFISSGLARMTITSDEVAVWARHLNTEGPLAAGYNIRNSGMLWMLGLKTEQNKLKVDTRPGGRTEILGAHMYTLGGKKDTPMFRVTDGAFCAAAMRETNFDKPPVNYEIYVEEIRNGEKRQLRHEDCPAAGSGAGRGFSLFAGFDSSHVGARNNDTRQFRAGVFEFGNRTHIHSGTGILYCAGDIRQSADSAVSIKPSYPGQCHKIIFITNIARIP